MSSPEGLLKLSLAEKLIKWDKAYRRCDFSHITERKTSTVSEAVFSTSWAKDIFRYWWKSQNPNYQRAKEHELRTYENWEILNGNKYRCWRIPEGTFQALRFSCGRKYKIKIDGCDRVNCRQCNPKPCKHPGGCTVNYTWQLHRTGRERSSLTTSTRVERNPQFAKVKLNRLHQNRQEGRLREKAREEDYLGRTGRLSCKGDGIDIYSGLEFPYITGEHWV